MTVTAQNPGPEDLLAKVMHVPDGNILKPHSVVEVRLVAAGAESTFELGPAQYLVIKGMA